MKLWPVVLTLATCLATVSLHAGSSVVDEALRQQVLGAIDADKDRLVGLYKDIHQNPELGFMETRTAGIVAKELKALGFEVKTGIGKTGVVGVLRNGPGPTVMFRADMDANAVAEATGLPFASKVRVKREGGEEVPVAHMCGHDAHVTWMLGLAKALVESKKQWHGTLVLVGQPAEEPILGAQAMVDDGLYTKHAVPVPDAFLALHTVIGPTGKIAARGGVIEAGTDQVDVTFHGVSAHGSQPHLSKDPVVMAAAAIMQYQTIVSRVMDPRDMGVLTVGAIHAGADNNTIPDSALLKLNLRFFDLRVRDLMLTGIRSINNGIARTYGLPEDRMPGVVMKGFAPPLDNDAALIGQLTPTLATLLGEDGIVDEFAASTGSEDAHLLRGEHETVPVAYMLVGIVEPAEFMAAVKAGKPGPYANHMPNFRVDLNAIPLGAKIGALAVLAALQPAE
jgi:amidohydrolase